MPLRNTTAEIWANRIYCLKADREKSSGRPSVESKPKNADDVENALYCKACGQLVTAKNQAIEVSSSFHHTFFNPAGIVFELGCYKQASGGRRAGPPSSEFSWFPGYLWRFALCSGCQTHLGWHFDSGTDAFWGLILNKLKE